MNAVDNYCPSQDWDRHCADEGLNQCVQCGGAADPRKQLPCCTDPKCRTPHCNASEDFCSLECLEEYQEPAQPAQIAESSR